MKREFKIAGTPVFEYEKPTSRRWERFKDWLHWVRYFSFGRGSVIELEDEDGWLFDGLVNLGWMHKRNGQLYFTRTGSKALIAYCNSIMSSNAADSSQHNRTSQ